MLDEEFINSLASLTLRQLVIKMVEWRTIRDDYKAKAAEAEEKFQHLQRVAVPERMDEMEVRNINFEGIGRVSLSPQIQVSTKQAMGPSLQDWMREHGFEDLIVESIHPSTLKGWVREQMETGGEVPNDLINIYAYTAATVTKG